MTSDAVRRVLRPHVRTRMTERNPDFQGYDGVADSHSRGSCAMRAARVAGGWTLLPPASGAECAMALRRAGLDVRLDGPDYAVVRAFGTAVIRVPLVKQLRPELLAALLKTLGVSPAKFTECLDPNP